MSDSWPELDPKSSEKTNLVELSVSELSSALKRTVEDQFGRVRVRGELSGVSRPASGHLYMTLKDDSSSIDTVCWKGVASSLAFRPEDGLEVVITGKLTTYAPRSKYQLVVSKMEIAGEGALMALLEKRKKMLAAEGLFDADRKKEIPHLPGRIGVVTSPSGAVIRDILHRLEDRFPRHVIVWPVKVQGEGAAEEIAAAIKGFNAMDADDPRKPDLLIVARGGGSIEDLWSFNEEVVARAAAASDIPLISSVGHETDTTLIDYVADHRAPTPTAAAERAVPVKAELEATVQDLTARLTRQKSRLITDRAEKLKQLTRALPTPNDMLALSRQKLDDSAERLPRALMAVVSAGHQKLNRLIGALSPRRLEDRVNYQQDVLSSRSQRMVSAMERITMRTGDRLTASSRMLESLSFKRVMERGYAVVSAADGTLVTSAKTLSAGDTVVTKFADGETAMTVTGDTEPVRKAKPKSAKKTKKKPKRDTRQGDLF